MCTRDIALTAGFCGHNRDHVRALTSALNRLNVKLTKILNTLKPKRIRKL